MGVDVGDVVADADDVGEFNMPVEEAVLTLETINQILSCGEVEVAVAFRELFHDSLSDRCGASVEGLELGEGGAPGVSGQLRLPHFGQLGQLLCEPLLVEN